MLFLLPPPSPFPNSLRSSRSSGGPPYRVLEELGLLLPIRAPERARLLPRDLCPRRAALRHHARPRAARGAPRPKEAARAALCQRLVGQGLDCALLPRPDRRERKAAKVQRARGLRSKPSVVLGYLHALLAGAAVQVYLEDEQLPDSDHRVVDVLDWVRESSWSIFLFFCVEVLS